MSEIKEKVSNYLKTDRSMSAGVVLYGSIPGRNQALAAQFARMTDTEANRKQVYYELCKLVGIPEGQKNSLLAERIGEAKEIKLPVANKKAQKTDTKEPQDRFDTMPWNDIKQEAANLPEGFTPKGKKKVDLLAALRAYEVQKEIDKKKASKPQGKDSGSGKNSPS